MSSRLVFWPLCRRYAKCFVGDRPADRVLSALAALQFRSVQGVWPDLLRPTNFSEKLWCRMLYARDPAITLLSDKLRVRDYVATTVGGQYLTRVHWSGDSAADIPFEKLPSRFVMKANHGCDYNVFVSEKARMDTRRVTRQMARWLRTNFCDATYLGIAWGYKNIKPAVLVEEMLEEYGKPPVDYKFHCFSGTVEFVNMHYDRFGQHRTVAVDRSFAPYDFSVAGVPGTSIHELERWKGSRALPANFDAMVDIAEKLSAGFDFLRVDMFNVEGRICFDEITLYPGGVSAKLVPHGLEERLGALWPGDGRRFCQS